MTSLAGRTIGFIGGGNMAEAIIKGLTISGAVASDAILVHDVVHERREYLGKTYGVEATEDNLQVARGSDVLILAVKPQMMAEVTAGLQGATDGRLACSIAAGVGVDQLREGLGSGARVIRVMPNTPALVQAGASALFAGPGVTDEDMGLAEAIFGAVGEVVRVANEGLMDAVTGLSGSGPAFVLMLLEAMSDAGVAAGLARPIASRLAAQTVYGTAKMAIESEQGFAALREMVTSPGGTTIAGCQALEEGAFRADVMRAIEAAVRRSRELGG